MSLTWTNPGWLWLLGAVAIPVAIHLLSRNAGRPLKFAALRFVPRAPLQRLLGIALTQRTLLALRCLMLVALTLLLAQPRWLPEADFNDAVAVLVSPLALAQFPASARELAEQEGRRLGVVPRVLDPVFPPLDRPPPASRPAEAIVRQMQDRLRGFEEVVIVIAPAGADRLWRQPRFDAPLRWLEIPSTAAPVRTVAVTAAADRAADAAVLRAAIRVAIGTGPKVRWRLLEGDIDADADVRFVLGQVEFQPPSLLLIRDTSAALDQTAELRLGGRTLLQAVADDGSINSGAVVLHAGTGGRPLVTLHQREVRIATRFHADAGPLAESGLLPLWIRDWLALASPSAPRWQPDHAPSAWWPALVLLLAWLIERWLSLRARPPGQIRVAGDAGG